MSRKRRSFYVGAKLEDHERAILVRDALNALGTFSQTYDWTNHQEREKNATNEVYAQAALAEIKGVIDADLIVFLAPGGRGMHAELGAALASQEMRRIMREGYATRGADRDLLDNWLPVPRIIFVGRAEGCVFYHHPDVEWLAEFDVKKLIDLVMMEF